jgi:hypothetical protein
MGHARSTAKRLRSASEQQASAPSWVARKATRGAWPHEAASARDNHGALTICSHAGGKPASVSAGSGLGGIKGGGGCSVDSLNQKSSS